jgi:hypothetical protein
MTKVYSLCHRCAEVSSCGFAKHTAGTYLDEDHEGKPFTVVSRLATTDSRIEIFRRIMCTSREDQPPQRHLRDSQGKYTE